MQINFTFWTFFGITLFIDLLTLLLYFTFSRNNKEINPYAPLRKVSVVIPVHKERGKDVKQTIKALYREKYRLYKIIVCGDEYSKEVEETVNLLQEKYPNLQYLQCPDRSKAKKINYLVKTKGDSLGEFLYIRDCKVIGERLCVEKMLSKFSDPRIGAVTSSGYVTAPKNFLARSYYYGKDWVNELGRFRKFAQEKRKAIFVVCGASTLYRVSVLKEVPIPSDTKTEDTHHTWRLQLKGYSIKVAHSTYVWAPDVDGKYLKGIKNQLKQGYRWSSGTMQCIYRERGNLFRHKTLFFTTILPGFLEALTYTMAFVSLPALAYFLPDVATGFLIGDTFFSLIATLILMPKKLPTVVFHYPQIFFYKYLHSFVFLSSFIVTTYQFIFRKTDSWSNEWSPISTTLAIDKIQENTVTPKERLQVISVK